MSALELKSVFMVEHEDPGCPEENYPGSTTIAYVGLYRMEAEQFIQALRDKDDWRWKRMVIVERSALLDEGQGLAVLVDPLNLGTQTGYGRKT